MPKCPNATADLASRGIMFRKLFGYGRSSPGTSTTAHNGNTTPSTAVDAIDRIKRVRRRDARRATGDLGDCSSREILDFHSISRRALDE